MNFSRATLLDVLAEVNEGQPEQRQLSYASIVAAAYRAEALADTPEEVVQLLSLFARTATKTTNKFPNAFVASCSDLLPEGHTAGAFALEDRIAWVLADPVLEPSKQPLLAACIYPGNSQTENIHAWTRLKVLGRQNLISKEFVLTVASLESEVSRGR